MFLNGGTGSESRLIDAINKAILLQADKARVSPTFMCLSDTWSEYIENV